MSSSAKAKLYHLTLNQMGGSAFWINQDARFMEVNATACQKLGYSHKELLGMTVHDIDPNFPKEAWPEHWKELKRRGALRFESCHRTKDGEVFPVDISVNYLEFEGQEFDFAFATDISTYKRAEEKLEHVYQSQRILDEILHISMQAVSMHEMLDQMLDAILTSPTFTLLKKGTIFLTKEDTPQLELITFRGLAPALQESCALLDFGQCLCGRAAESREIVFADHVDERHEITYDGIQAHGHYCVPIISEGQVLGVFNTYVPEGQERKEEDERLLRTVAGTLALAIERKRTFDKLECMAHKDHLTGLLNRAVLYDRLDQALALARRHKQGFAVLFLDLDHFKEVNDTLGHDAGDELLKEAATRLQGCVREVDTVARVGGDEFTIILMEVAEPAGAERVAHKILETLTQPFNISGNECCVGTSIGIAEYPSDGEDSETLVKHADTAMYQAKQTRNTYRFYSQ